MQFSVVQNSAEGCSASYCSAINCKLVRTLVAGILTSVVHGKTVSAKF